MSDYFDCGQWTETASGKKRFVKLGSAKQNDKGNWDIYLDALPMPGPKGCRLSIMPQRERGAAPAINRRELDDEIPF